MSTMEIDPNETDIKIIKKNSEALQSLATGSLSTSIARLAGSSRGIPSDKDFHYYYLFDEFRSLIDEIAATSKAMLEKIGSAQQFSGSGSGNVFPGEDIDDNAAYNGLVGVNDEILERFDVSVEEFLQIRKEQEVASANKGAVGEDGFQLVRGKKKKTAMTNHGADDEMNERRELTSVRVVEKDKKVAAAKSKIPFHLPSIKRPQDEHNILVNNANQPFEHVWLQKSEDGLKFIHPLEKLSVKEFAVHNTVEPQKPAALENTPFKMVETVKDLKEMAAKLRNVDEIAVDLEHNQYRSFQGLTCLMQISTRTEDFVVDTLKLRIHIGPYLREIFKDPSKKKVMHGADRDIIWLQRDFGIYVCNLFDTGQASRVLQMERNSLEYLLHHFCEVTANKEYQNADWRLRPLPLEMIRYAREDTHYLLYIYDLMRGRLLSQSTEGNIKDLLLEVYQRSSDICMQLYEKELLTETSYLHLYGLQAANFNAQQLSIVSGLYEWRDTVARAEDESTGYILPNKALLEIAKQMPVTTGKLKRLARYKNPYIERNLASVVNIVRHSIQHAAAFEAVVKQLAETRPEVVKPVSEAPAPLSLVGEGSLAVPDSSMVERVIDNSGPGKVGDPAPNVSPNLCHNNDVNGSVNNDPNGSGKNICVESQKATGATVQILKRPSRGFGALLGSSSKKKVDPSSKEELIKLEQIKSSVNLPFHSFAGDDQTSKKTTKPPSETTDTCPPEENDDNPKESKTEDIIPLEGISNEDEDETRENSETITGEHEEGELMSLSTLSSSLNRCIESSSEKQTLGNTEEPSGLQIKPFDYETATKTTKFGGGGSSGGGGGGGAGKKKSTRGGGGGSSSNADGAEAAKQDQGTLPQGRRRQAFPASGNRSATFL